MKYLIYCGPGIGDFMLILPMANSIKKFDKNAHIRLIIASDKNRVKINKALLNFQKYIDTIEYYSVGELLHTGKLILRLGYHSCDYGFVLQYTDNTNTSMWPYRIVKYVAKKTCGISLKNKPKVRYDYNIPFVKGKSIIDFPFEMLKTVGIPPIRDYGCLLKKAEIERYYELPVSINNKKIIALCIGTAMVSYKINGKLVRNPAKNWTYENWLELADRLANFGYGVILLGGNKEKKEVEEKIGKQLHKNIQNMIGKCNIIESMAIICKSYIVVGSDTGMIHCAGALGVLSLTLFGCTDYREYLAMGDKSYYLTANEKCSPCFGTEKAVMCKDILCMKNILVENVYKKILELMSEYYEDNQV